MKQIKPTSKAVLTYSTHLQVKSYIQTELSLRDNLTRITNTKTNVSSLLSEEKGNTVSNRYAKIKKTHSSHS